MYGYWNTKRVRHNFLPFWTIFCTFIPLTTRKIKIFQKIMKPHGDIISLHICAINGNHMIYASWDIEHNRQNFLVILDPFLPFYKPNNPKNQSFEKMENSPGGIIILNMCTINDNHMMYSSWDIERDRPNFLLFWTIICTFTIQKIKILKKWKSAKRNYHFTQVYQKSWSYTRLFLRNGVWHM